MGNEDQDLTTHTKKIKRKNCHLKKGKHPHQNKKDIPKISSRDLSSIRFSTCDEKGHFTRDCPRNKGGSQKDNKIRHHAHTTEDDEPPRKRFKEEDSSSDEEYVLIFALTGNVTHGSNDWLIDSGASKHMIGFKESFVKLSEHESPHKVKLGDD